MSHALTVELAGALMSARVDALTKDHAARHLVARRRQRREQLVASRIRLYRLAAG